MLSDDDFVIKSKYYGLYSLEQFFPTIFLKKEPAVVVIRFHFRLAAVYMKKIRLVQ